jgi:hypothetical protein
VSSDLGTETATPPDLHEFLQGRTVSQCGMPRQRAGIWQSKYLTAWLVLLFFLSLPFVNPWVRGDGVGYYAYARSPLIEHRFDFAPDWLHANASFTEGRVDDQGHILASEYTVTGHIDDHFSVGPAILWSPFLLLAHGLVKAADEFGFDIPADGFSRPYRIAMAVSTAFYGFLGLLLSYDLSRRYFAEKWAFLATLAIWCASSLPVYMYFNPSWSHAHSAFAVSLFLWYWSRTRPRRSWLQWAVLGALSGLMINVYYLNAIFLVLIVWEAVSRYRQPVDSVNKAPVLKQLEEYALFVFVTMLALTPTLLTKWVIYGKVLESGYPRFNSWSWTSPKIFAVLFSADHGLLSWTPLLLPAVIGLMLLARTQPVFGGGLLSAFVVYLYCVASFTNWDGLSSFGNRFFISFTPAFVIGLAALLENLARRLSNPSKAMRVAGLSVAALIVWNLGLMVQWGTQMIPARGPISWSMMIRNQIVGVPKRVVGDLGEYFANRSLMMEQIEKRDRSAQQPGEPAN